MIAMAIAMTVTSTIASKKYITTDRCDSMKKAIKTIIQEKTGDIITIENAEMIEEILCEEHKGLENINSVAPEEVAEVYLDTL